MKIHKGDDVLVLAGKFRGERAKVEEAMPASTCTRSPLRIFIQSTSGASDTMRMNFLSRSSRPTGPKMRVPRGCCWSLI